MKKVLMIYTGGTIGMVQNTATGALESFHFEHLLRQVPELKQVHVDVNTYTFDPPVDSSSIVPEHWSRMARLVADNYTRYDGFVILHGTDTMAYTASALSFMLDGLAKPVVLTGSQLPIGMLRTDGKENLVTAIEIAAATRPDGLPMVPEVCIFFHDTLLRGNRATKSSSDHFNAFQSFNYPALATAAVDIRYHSSLIRDCYPDEPLVVHEKLDSNLMVVSLFPGMREDILRTMLSADGLKGVVLRTFGAGNAPQEPWLIDLLKDATERGIVIVNITQCAGGSVAMNRYETGLQLMQAGVVSGGDSTVEAALTKMMVLFGCGLSSAEVKKKMTVSLCGEIG